MKKNSAYLIEVFAEALEEACVSKGTNGFISVCVGIDDIRKALDIAEGVLLDRNLKPLDIYSVQAIGVEMLEDLVEPFPTKEELLEIESNNGIWFSDFMGTSIDLK